MRWKHGTSCCSHRNPKEQTSLPTTLNTYKIAQQICFQSNTIRTNDRKPSPRLACLPLFLNSKNKKALSPTGFLNSTNSLNQNISTVPERGNRKMINAKLWLCGEPLPTAHQVANLSDPLHLSPFLELQSIFSTVSKDKNNPPNMNLVEYSTTYNFLKLSLCLSVPSSVLWWTPKWAIRRRIRWS